MNVCCPECKSVFRIDPAKVPAGGVRARCSVCSGVIPIEGASRAVQPAAEPQPRPVSHAVGVPEAPVATGGAPIDWAAMPVAAARPAPAEPEVPATAASRKPINPFLARDPNLRAKRLAKALVSDIITYHPARHAEGLRDGTLKQLFKDEIRKSYEEYSAQVGQQVAESTSYFQEALNDVLGAGKKIF